MNGTHCNQNQTPKNLPLKKRRAFIVDPPNIDADNANHGQDENYLHQRSTTNKQ